MELEQQLIQNAEKNPNILSLTEITIYFIVNQKLDRARKFAIELVKIDCLNPFAHLVLRSVLLEEIGNNDLFQIVIINRLIDNWNLLGPSGSLKQIIQQFYELQGEERVGVLRTIKFIHPDENELLRFLERIFSTESDEALLKEALSLIRYFDLVKSANFLYRFSQGFRVADDNIQYRALGVLMHFLVTYPVDTIKYFTSYQNFFNLNLVTPIFKQVKEFKLTPEELPKKMTQFERACNLARVVHKWIDRCHYQHVQSQLVPRYVIDTYNRLKSIDFMKGVTTHNFTLDWISAGILARILNEKEIAFKCFEIATRGKMNKDMAYFHRATLHLEKGEKIAAKKDLELLILYSSYNRFIYFDFLSKYGINITDIDPEDPTIWRLLFYIYLFDGRDTELAMALEEHDKRDLEKIFENPTSRFQWIELAQKMGVAKRCMLLGKTAQDKLELARFYQLIEKNPERALPIYEQATNMDPTNSLIWFWWGAALYELNRLNDAKQKFEQTIRLFDEFDEAWKTIIDIHYKSKEYELAIQTVDQASEVLPSCIEILAYRGWILNDQHRFQESLQVFENLKTIDPIEAKYGKACTYALMGEEDKALYLLKETIMDYPQYRSRAKDDSDFISLQSNEQFKKMME